MLQVVRCYQGNCIMFVRTIYLKSDRRIGRKPRPLICYENILSFSLSPSLPPSIPSSISLPLPPSASVSPSLCLFLFLPTSLPPSVRLHDSISEEAHHYLIFDLWVLWDFDTLMTSSCDVTLYQVKLCCVWCHVRLCGRHAVWCHRCFLYNVVVVLLFVRQHVNTKTSELIFLKVGGRRNVR